MMHRSLTVGALLALLYVTNVQAAEDIVFRTSVTPEDPWVGQQVLLRVDVLAKDGWAQLKKVTETEVQGAYMLRLESQGTRLNDTIDGDSYSGQRYEYMLFTQRDGDFAVPPMPVDVEVSRYGTGDGPKTYRMSLPVVEFSTRMPPGAENIRGLISTTSLTATQDWSSETGEATVGDALTRTITLQATDVSAMAFTPLSHPDIVSVAIYPEQPSVDDRFARGDLTGSRIESATYVFEKAGNVDIPEISLSWWDIRSERLHTVDLPGVSLQIAKNPLVEQTASADFSPQEDRQRLWYSLFAIAVIAAFAMFHGGRLMARLSQWRKDRQHAESTYFRKVISSGRSGNRNDFLRDTMSWLDRINTNTLPARLDEFLAMHGDAKTREAAARLMRSVEAKQEQSELRVLADGLKVARGRWLGSRKAKQESSNLLPELNG